MPRPFPPFRSAISLAVVAGLATTSLALAQAPPTTAPPPTATSPVPPTTASPPPAETAVPTPSTPQPPPSSGTSPGLTPPAAQVQVADPFGEETTLTARTVVVARGQATWESAFETLMDSFKTLSAVLEKQGIKSTGNPMIVYTSTDDNGFNYMAELPVDQEPKTLPKDVTIGRSPDGKALKFVHRGSYDNMDNTYEAITNHLDDKKLEAKDTFIEEYLTDPLKTAEDKLVINVYVPLK
jgi:effector-binding domain-containing protein